ncbi:uncharacterized protein LAJ45_04205 [Morchella importuna]|uniref:uncharacterized protein n=1 Tax=Morchella importuna TaxID=1174673 RepID=UPI001E8CEEFC|nr:uncharacterized protein LAJ45_04205 [Morchella importuna]KAH8151583.1 hypothetical protein LAJ45_04205 [Morchella importuna]
MLPGCIISFFLFTAVFAAPPFFTRDEPKAYVAGFSGVVEGSVKFTSTGGGAGVSIDYKLFVPNNLLGPFSYHIHENPVPADGNCAGTGGHFDPFKPNSPRTGCDRSKSWTCEIGDLSGKLYPFPQSTTDSPSLTATLRDPWISVIPGNAAFIGGRSIVVHNINKDRIGCATLVPL